MRGSLSRAHKEFPDAFSAGRFQVQNTLWGSCTHVPEHTHAGSTWEPSSVPLTPRSPVCCLSHLAQGVCVSVSGARILPQLRARGPDSLRAVVATAGEERWTRTDPSFAAPSDGPEWLQAALL